MNTPLRKYLEQQLVEYGNKLSQLKSRKAELVTMSRECDREIEQTEKELLEIERALRAVSFPSTDLSHHADEGDPKQMTIKRAVLSVLSRSPGGLIARDILSQINARYGWAIERTSLSPQLSRLKQEGKISLNGNVWHRLNSGIARSQISNA